MSDDILHEVREGGIAWTTFNRPQARNAMLFPMYQRIQELADEISEDPNIRVWVLTGAGGKAFASGTDISQFREFKTAEDALTYEARIDKVLGALENCTKPVIAAIAGACTGGGAAIAACCDLRIATRSLKFGFPIARTLGNCLSVANYARLAHLIGPARVKDLFFTARLMEADEALSVGIVNELVDDHATLMRRARELTATVAGNAPLTLRATKEALRRIAAAQTLPPDDDLVGLCYGSQDFREGIDSFLTKRPPQWKGR